MGVLPADGSLFEPISCRTTAFFYPTHPNLYIAIVITPGPCRLDMGVVSAGVRFMAHLGPQTCPIIYIYYRAHETVTSATAKTNPFKLHAHSHCRAKSQSNMNDNQIIENANTIAKVRPRARSCIRVEEVKRSHKTIIVRMLHKRSIRPQAFFYLRGRGDEGERKTRAREKEISADQSGWLVV